MPDAAPAEDGGASPPPIEIRCEACRTVVSTRHAWEAVTCACGALTVSGRPSKPRVSWVARPGAGWSEAIAAPADASDAEVPDDDESARPVRRPIGYAP